jgi:hypothetical protein
MIFLKLKFCMCDKPREFLKSDLKMDVKFFLDEFYLLPCIQKIFLSVLTARPMGFTHN